MRSVSNYFSNLTSSLWPCLLFWGIFLIAVWKDRSRYRNSAFLMVALLFTIPLIASLSGKYYRFTMLFILTMILLVILMVPVLLIANGIQMVRKEGRSLANLLSMLVGILVGIGEISTFLFVLVPWINYSTTIDIGSSFLSWFLLLISLSAIYFSISFVSFMFYSLFLEIIPRKRDFDYVIIHGAGLIRGNQVSRLLADRLDKAIEVYHKDPTPPVLVPSGGQGSDESVSEARAMADYLIEHGIPEKDIMLEDTSTTTMENLINSKHKIEQRSRKYYAALVTSNYHVYRALRYCKKIGLKCTGIGSHVAPYYWPSALIREYIAIHSEKKHLFLLSIGWLILVGFPMYLMFRF